MLARRLLVLAAVLLALGAVAASLAPRDLRGPSSTTTAGTSPPAASPTPAQGREVSLVVDASARPLATVTARVGDDVHLAVRASAPDSVRIEALGQSEAADPYSPARFDFVPDRPGSFPITLAQSGRRVGVLRIVPAP
jgi:hypothetical protein